MEKMTFWGYRRPDGRVGIRNKILILPASVCASDTTRIIASQVESAVTFNNQNGCSQVPSDQQFTMDVMAGMQQTRTYMERSLYHLDVKTVRWILC